MSERYPGGIISKTAPVPSGPYQNSTASGVWTLDQQAFWEQQGLWPTAGNVNPDLFIENLFSTFLYTGNDTSQTINNGLDLSTKGGLVWIKGRNTAYSHILSDTVRGTGKFLSSNTTDAQGTDAQDVTAFNTNGFTVGNNGRINNPSTNYCSWTFREQAKFFDVVTYTGNGSSPRAISHSLGSVPGMIIVKATSVSGENWTVYHRQLNGGTNPQNYGIYLNTTAAEVAESGFWNNTAPTSTQFTVGGNLNSGFGGGVQYVAYLFAHDAGGFGTSGTDNVITCGSYTGTGANGNNVTLGYEPQWVMTKRINGQGNWNMEDVMRGLLASGNAQELLANESAAEQSSSSINITSTGFQLQGASGDYNGSGNTYIYMAIRRGPMKVPTTGTEVFTPATRTGTGTTGVVVTNANFPIDLVIGRNRNAAAAPVWIDRLRGATVELRSDNDDAQAASTIMSSTNGLASQNGWVGSTGGTGAWNVSSANYIQWYFRRAPGFFDEVCYTGTGSAGASQTHNLGVAPELMIIKRRNTVGAWNVGTQFTASDFTYSTLNSSSSPDLGALYNAGYGWFARPTATAFTLDTYSGTNASGSTYVAYLFATLAGVSKVGSYTGTGTTQVINCGFTGGARFVLIRRTSGTGDWYVWDSARGIVAGDDPYLLLNSTAAEVTNTDFIDTASSGFEISSTAPAAINANGGTFIFLAIA